MRLREDSEADEETPPRPERGAGVRRRRCRARPRPTPSAHRHELFGARRMNRDRVVEVALARAHRHGDREALDHLVGAEADHVAADDALVGADASRASSPSAA